MANVLIEKTTKPEVTFESKNMPAVFVAAHEAVMEEIPKTVKVQTSDNIYLSLSRYEVSVLQSHRGSILGLKVDVKKNKTSSERHVWLVVLTICQAHLRRILHGIRPPESKQGVTRRHQERGAKKWVERLDRVRSGQFSVVHSIQTKVQSKEEIANRTAEAKRLKDAYDSERAAGRPKV